MNKTRGEKIQHGDKIKETAQKVAELLTESKTTFADVNSVFDMAKSILVCDIH